MPIEQLVQQIQASAKYRHVSEEVIRRIALREIEAQGDGKAAIKTTKNRLHQIGGAFMEGTPRYATWLENLAAAKGEGGQEALRAVCGRIMEAHASTRERLRLLPDFYTTLFANIPPPRSVLDIACGFHPLAIPWMALHPDTTYFACDIYADMMQFLNRFFALVEIPGRATVCDVAAAPPRQAVDVAFVLKTLPTLEQQDRNAGLTLLRGLNARFLIVSFPTRSLGGRSKGMAEQYETRFREMIAAEPWQVQRFAFANERCFLVTKA